MNCGRSLVCASLLLAGCVSDQRFLEEDLAALDETPPPAEQTEGEAEQTLNIAAMLSALANREYRIGPGDVLEVFAVDIQEASGIYTVGPDGRISLPYVGVIELGGATRARAAERIEERLAEKYRSPQVDIVVREYNNNRVFVLGEVRRPGEFNFAGPPTLLGALARAQGLTSDADLRGCTIVRGHDTLIEVNLYDLLRRGNRQLNISLLPGDTVYVKDDDDNSFYVLGEVGRPGAYSRTETVDLVDAIARAGGLTDDAQKREVRIVRRRKDGAAPEIRSFDLKRLLESSPDMPTPRIRKADIVYVPRRHLASFNYVLRQITPSLNLFLLGDAVSTALDDE